MFLQDGYSPHSSDHLFIHGCTCKLGSLKTISSRDSTIKDDNQRHQSWKRRRVQCSWCCCQGNFNKNEYQRFCNNFFLIIIFDQIIMLINIFLIMVWIARDGYLKILFSLLGSVNSNHVNTEYRSKSAGILFLHILSGWSGGLVWSVRWMGRTEL